MVVADLMKTYPQDMDGGLVPLAVLRKYPEYCKYGACYIDLWPISWPMLAVFNPEMMAQFCQAPSLPKHDLMHYEFGPFTNSDDLVNSEGEQWKTWRSILSPGFSARNVQALMPEMLEEIQVFRDILRSLAETGETVPMTKLAASLTVDVIARAVLGARLQVQTHGHEFFNALKRQIRRLIVDATPYTLLHKTLNPVRPFLMWKDNRLLRQIVLPYIHDAIKDHGDKGTTKTINGLAVQAYLKEHSAEGGIKPRWAEIAISQLKIFMFAGHDTTASTLSFAYALLHESPKALAKVREELRTVFGSDPSRVADQIARAPEILNQLPYVTAVLKETLRLYPPVGSVRRSSKDFYIVHPDTGTKLPTYGWMLFSASVVEQRNPQFWPRPDEFIPERFLAVEGDELYPPKNAFRPFELGPRNCIGQELAMAELRSILAMTVQEFDIIPAFADDVPKVFGRQAYQTRIPSEATAHPKDSCPMRVALRQ